MKPLLAVLMLVAFPAVAVQPATCGSLCGNWRLDTTISAAVAPAVDAALRSYSDPRVRRPARSQRSREGHLETTVEQIDAALENSLGPMIDRPVRADLRAELMSLLTPPAQLSMEARAADILIKGDGQLTRKLSPGTEKTRVNAEGSATILATWKSNRLTITERYDRKRRYNETYVLQSADDSLLVTREVQRPGMKPLRIQAVYRRA
jgi:hypothetical protein